MKTQTIKNVLMLIGVAVVVTISGLIWPFQDTRPEAVLKRQGVRFSYGVNGKDVIGVWMEGSKFGDDDVALVVGIPKVRDLSLAGAKVTRRGVEALRSVTALRSLDLSHTQLTGDALEVVGQLSGLEELKLAGCRWVRDEHLALLSPLAHLVRLDLSDTSITPAGLKSLQSLGSLTSLHLEGGTVINDDAVEPLGQFAKLSELWLTDCELSSQGYLRLRQVLPKARIVLPPTSMTDLRGFAGRCSFSVGVSGEIASLSVDQRPDSDGVQRPGGEFASLLPGDMKVLNSLTELQRLHLGGSNVTDEMLSELQTHFKLNYLDLGRTTITDEGLACLTKFPSLETLILSETRVSGRGLSYLSHTPHLAHFYAELQQGDEIIEPVGQLTELRELSLNCPLTDAGVAKLKGLTKLGSLRLVGTLIRGPGLKSLAALPNLAYLSFLRGTIDDSAVEAIAEIPSLLEVIFTETHVTQAAVDRLKSLRPGLKVEIREPLPAIDPAAP